MQWLVYFEASTDALISFMTLDFPMSALLQFSQFVQKTFALWVILFSAIALMLPDLFVWLRAYIPWMLGLIMFGMGMTMTPGDFKSILQSPKAVAIGVVAQFMVMPGLAFCSVSYSSFRLKLRLV